MAEELTSANKTDAISLDKIVTPPVAAKTKPGLFQFKKSSADNGSSFITIKYIYPLTIVIIVLIVSWLMSFLYNNVYLTMSQAEAVSTLKSKVIEGEINFTKFNAIISKITLKKKPSEPISANGLTSPFDYGKRSQSNSPAPTTIATPTTGVNTPASSSSPK